MTIDGLNSLIAILKNGGLIGGGGLAIIIYNRYIAQKDKKNDRDEKKEDEYEDFWKTKAEEAGAGKAEVIKENKALSLELSSERAAHAITTQRFNVAFAMIDKTNPANTEIIEILTRT